MTVSELIAALRELQEEFGDLKVKTGIAAEEITQAYLVDENDEYHLAIEPAD